VSRHHHDTHQDEYAAEGVAWQQIDFHDNTRILSLIENKPDGILPTLDDQCLVASSSDASLLAVLKHKHSEGSCPEFALNKFSLSTFIIKHSAGPVEYEVRYLRNRAFVSSATG
jgi:myosin-5